MKGNTNKWNKHGQKEEEISMENGTLKRKEDPTSVHI